MNAWPGCPALALRCALLVAALILGPLAAPGRARADDPLGLYIGAAYGQAHIRAQLGDLGLSSAEPLGEFDATHSAYQAMLGIRPLSFLGAEITYMDFGRITLGQPPVNAVGSAPAGGSDIPVGQQVSQRGEAAFALLYLPVPVIDLYVKAGISRITTDATVAYLAGGTLCAASYPNCNIYSIARSNTEVAFAYGAGLQWKLGQWAVRGEYQRFRAAGENPILLSIGMTYWIP